MYALNRCGALHRAEKHGRLNRNIAIMMDLDVLLLSENYLINKKEILRLMAMQGSFWYYILYRDISFQHGV